MKFKHCLLLWMLLHSFSCVLILSASRKDGNKWCFPISKPPSALQIQMIGNNICISNRHAVISSELLWRNCLINLMQNLPSVVLEHSLQTWFQFWLDNLDADWHGVEATTQWKHLVDGGTFCAVLLALISCTNSILPLPPPQICLEIAWMFWWATRLTQRRTAVYKIAYKPVYETFLGSVACVIIEGELWWSQTCFCVISGLCFL